MGEDHWLLASTHDLDIITLENGGHGRSIKSNNR
jgi:hypothetical protein